VRPSLETVSAYDLYGEWRIIRDKQWRSVSSALEVDGGGPVADAGKLPDTLKDGEIFFPAADADLLSE
jgi:hypothetical protein